MPYVYRVSRRTTIERQPGKAGVTVSAVSVTPAKVSVAAEPSYRDLQAQAKEAGIPANQTADDLKKALAEAGNGG